MVTTGGFGTSPVTPEGGGSLRLVRGAPAPELRVEGALS
jgi:hypothetical protein